MKLFEYALILHPTTEQKKKGERSKLLNGGIQHVLAPDESGAAMLAGRAIPEEQIGTLDRIEVCIRPF